MRADDDTKTHHHHRHQEAAKKTEPVKTGTTAIPTRDDRSSQEVKGNITGGGNGPEYRVRTGTNLPDHYDRRAYSTNSRDNEFIYDQNDIRIQSTNTVQDSLRNVPSVTVSGMR